MPSLQLRFLASSTLIGVSLIAVLVLFLQIIGYPLDFLIMWIVVIIAAASGGINYFLGREGQTKWVINIASIALTLTNISLVGVALFHTGGIESPFLWVFSIIVIIDLLIKGVYWALFSAAGSILAIIAVNVHLHWDAISNGQYALFHEIFLTQGNQVMPQVIFFITMIALVRYVESARMFHDFGLKTGLRRTHDLKHLLVSMVEPDTIEETVDVVYKELKKFLDYDFLAVTRAERSKVEFIYQKGLPKSVTGYKTAVKRFPNKSKLLTGAPCLCDIKKSQTCEKLSKLHVRNTIISPITQDGKLTGLLLIGVRNRQHKYSETDIELIKTVTEQFQHIWKLQETVLKLRSNERKLKKALQEKRELRALKSEFISITSHQLRTPLASIKWFLEMLINGDFGKLNNDQNDAVTQVSEANQRMITLINDMMEVAKVDDGKLQARMKPTSIDDIIKQTLDDNRIVSHAKNISLVYEEPEKSCPKIHVDPALFEQVIQNLVSNSIKYTPARGTVEIHVEPKQSQVIVSVKDTGIGIKKAEQKNIFQKFYRSEEVKRMATSGSGLGLYLSKAMIEIMDGKIWFKSQPGKGSTFYVAAPISKQA